MSIEYCFRDPQRRKNFCAAGQAIIKEIDKAIAAVQAYNNESIDGLKDGIDDVVDKLIRIKAGVCLDFTGEKEGWIIGTSTRSRFHWRQDNGFTSIESVELFLSTHPDFIIVDEYGEEIPLDEFKKVVE